jgi:hypothetical protein
VNINLLGLERGALQMARSKQNGNFLENISGKFDEVLVICGDHLQKQSSICGIFRKFVARALGDHMQ